MAGSNPRKGSLRFSVKAEFNKVRKPWWWARFSTRGDRNLRHWSCYICIEAAHFLLFIGPRTPGLGMVRPTFRMGLSSSAKPPWTHPHSDTPKGAFPRWFQIPVSGKWRWTTSAPSLLLLLGYLFLGPQASSFHPQHQVIVLPRVLNWPILNQWWVV